MRNHFESLALVMAVLTLATSIPAQEPPAALAGLSITILEGDNAIVNTRQRLSREAIVQVEDENHKPVAGAAVTLFAPNSGPSAVFSNGSNNITILTDNQGRAVVRGIKPNSVAGKAEIKITATKEGFRSATSILTQTNAIAAAAGLSAGMIGLIVAVAASAGIGIAVAAGGGGGGGGGGNPGGGGTVTRPTVLTPGAPTVGAPR